MKKLMIVCIAILALLSACANAIPEPEQCSLCAGLPCHAPCIINLSTGEMLELAVYEPHPFIAGELAEEQQSETFSFVRGAGVDGYRLSGESITITIPMVADAMEEKHFCNTCRERLDDCASQGYALVDLKDISNPIIYAIGIDLEVSFRCYNIIANEAKEDEKYEIRIIGTLD
jgi:hypothetical protein